LAALQAMELPSKFAKMSDGITAIFAEFPPYDGLNEETYISIYKDVTRYPGIHVATLLVLKVASLVKSLEGIINMLNTSFNKKIGDGTHPMAGKLNPEDIVKKYKDCSAHLEQLERKLRSYICVTQASDLLLEFFKLSGDDATDDVMPLKEQKASIRKLRAHMDNKTNKGKIVLPQFINDHLKKIEDAKDS